MGYNTKVCALMEGFYVEGESRRKAIIDTLKQSDKPLSGTELAGQLGVSRQCVVGDIALLRATSEEIIATNKGYIYNPAFKKKRNIATIKVSHKSEDIFDELCTIIDYGGKVLDTSVPSPAYGSIRVELPISNRIEASDHAEKFVDGTSKHLSELSGGIHFHTIEAHDEIALIRIQKALNEKGYLAK